MPNISPYILATQQTQEGWLIIITKKKKKKRVTLDRCLGAKPAFFFRKTHHWNSLIPVTFRR